MLKATRANGHRPIAVICGSGATKFLPDEEELERIETDTPFGRPSASIAALKIHGLTVYVLHRHGDGHTIPPHRINYRANIWALAELGCDAVIGIATVGGIRDDLKPGTLFLPDQLIDYTWGRNSTFFDGDFDDGVGHLENASPYCTALRNLILRAAQHENIGLLNGGVYAVTQGPRFETAAEIDRIEKDGGDVVGMTGMPETALAAEQRMCYASINLVVNPAAGRSREAISKDAIREVWAMGYRNLQQLLAATIRQLADHKNRPLRLNSHVMKIE